MPSDATAAITKRERYERLRSALKSDRATFDVHWRELADFFFPRRTRFWTGDRNKGDKRNQNIINSTGRFAARTLQSGLHAGLTSPARPWMKLTVPDQELASHPPIKEWLRSVTERMLVLFSVSNTYNVLPIVYGDMGVFGTAAMAVLEDTRDLFRVYQYPLGSYYLATDARGLVSTFVRDYQFTVRQVVEQFGLQEDGRTIDWSPISRTVKDQWTQGNYEAPVDCCWIVQPNTDYRRDRLAAKYLPFTSCHFEVGTDERVFLRESGFRTFPIMAPRWDITGEDTYGTDSPGMTALGDNKQLQIMERYKGKAIIKMVDPPLVGPQSLRSQKTSILPGDVTYVDVREGMQGLRSVHEVNLRIDQLAMDIDRVEYRIKRAFYEDLFLMLATSDPIRGAQPPTAREIEERHEEKLLALGPVLERTNDELLDPLIDRVFSLMATHNLLPTPPQELEGVDLKVEYVSILAEAQKLVGVVGQDRFLQSTLPLTEAYPEIREKINIMQVVDNYADMLGVDPRTIRPTEEAEQRVAAAQQQQQQMLDAQQAQTIAKAAKDASGAKMGQDSALDRLVTQMGAGGP